MSSLSSASSRFLTELNLRSVRGNVSPSIVVEAILTEVNPRIKRRSDIVLDEPPRKCIIHPADPPPEWLLEKYRSHRASMSSTDRPLTYQKPPGVHVVKK